MIRKNPKYSIVFNLHKELRAIPVMDRKRMIENPEDTRLEDVDVMLYGNDPILPEVDRLISVPPLSSREINKIYELVAERAAIKFGRSFTSKQVMLIMRRWSAFERSLDC